MIVCNSIIDYSSEELEDYFYKLNEMQEIICDDILRLYYECEDLIDFNRQLRDYFKYSIFEI